MLEHISRSAGFKRTPRVRHLWMHGQEDHTHILVGLLQLNERVNAVADYLKEGQKVRVKVLEADEKGRVRLSMKALSVEEGGVPPTPAAPAEPQQQS